MAAAGSGGAARRCAGASHSVISHCAMIVCSSSKRHRNLIYQQQCVCCGQYDESQTTVTPVTVVTVHCDTSHMSQWSQNCDTSHSASSVMRRSISHTPCEKNYSFFQLSSPVILIGRNENFDWNSCDNRPSVTHTVKKKLQFLTPFITGIVF